MKSKVDSQNKKIEKFLETGKSINAMDALHYFGTFRLSARIFDLANRKVNPLPIEKQMIERNGKRFAQYRMER